jgi:hypothetical protein
MEGRSKKGKMVAKRQQNETKFEGRIKKEDAIREERNISENEKKKDG